MRKLATSQPQESSRVQEMNACLCAAPFLHLYCVEPGEGMTPPTVGKAFSSQFKIIPHSYAQRPISPVTVDFVKLKSTFTLIACPASASSVRGEERRW